MRHRFALVLTIIGAIALPVVMAGTVLYASDTAIGDAGEPLAPHFGTAQAGSTGQTTPTHHRRKQHDSGGSTSGGDDHGGTSGSGDSGGTSSTSGSSDSGSSGSSGSGSSGGGSDGGSSQGGDDSSGGGGHGDD
jgi:hypothetical protein